MRKAYEDPALSFRNIEIADCIAISHIFSDDGVDFPIDDILPGQSPEELLASR